MLEQVHHRCLASALALEAREQDPARSFAARECAQRHRRLSRPLCVAALSACQSEDAQRSGAPRRRLLRDGPDENRGIRGIARRKECACERDPRGGVRGIKAKRGAVLSQRALAIPELLGGLPSQNVRTHVLGPAGEPRFKGVKCLGKILAGVKQLAPQELAGRSVGKGGHDGLRTVKISSSDQQVPSLEAEPLVAA